MRDLRYLAVLLAVSAFLFLFGLGNMALTDPDETFYAQSAREMHESNEWVTPTIFGNPQFEKPVMYYWLIELSYEVFGVSEFAARFPSAVFGVIGVLGIYLLGRLLFSPLCGLIAGLLTATSVEYLVLARGCVTDMVLSVFILLCLTFFVKAWLSEGGGGRFYVLSAVMAAFAVLTKGPIGLFIPAMVMLVYIASVRGWKRLFGIPILWCALAFAAVALPWYVIAAMKHGQLFFDEFFGFHNFTRFLHPEHRIGSSPWFYFPVVAGGFLPWSIFTVFAVWDMWKNGKEGDSPFKAFRVFLLAWFLVVFVFFSVSRTKLVTYIFPLFPVLSIVTARFWERAIRERSAFLEKSLYGAYALVALLSLAGTIGGYIALKMEFPDSPLALAGMVWGVTLFAAAFALSVIFLLRGRKGWSFASIVGGLIIGSLPVVFLILPVVEKYESSKAVCEAFLKYSKPGEPVAGESDNRRGIAFYTGRFDVVDVHPQDELMKFITRKERVWCIIQKKHLPRLVKDGTFIVPPPVFEGKKKVLITNIPLVEGQGSAEIKK